MPWRRRRTPLARDARPICAMPLAPAPISTRCIGDCEAHAGRTARDRRPPCPTRPTDGGASVTITGRGHRLAEVRSGRRLRSADHGWRSVPRFRNVSLTQAPRVVDGCVPRHRRERRQELQSPLPEGQPADATRSESGRERRREGQGHHLRDCLSPACPAARARASIGAITHRLCRLIWKILHQGVRYEERGPAVSHEAKKVRARKMIRELRSLGYRVELLPAPSSNPA